MTAQAYPGGDDVVHRAGTSTDCGWTLPSAAELPARAFSHYGRPRRFRPSSLQGKGETLLVVALFEHLEPIAMDEHPGKYEAEGQERQEHGRQLPAVNGGVGLQQGRALVKGVPPGRRRSGRQRQSGP